MGDCKRGGRFSPFAASVNFFKRRVKIKKQFCVFGGNCCVETLFLHSIPEFLPLVVNNTYFRVMRKKWNCRSREGGNLSQHGSYLRRFRIKQEERDKIFLKLLAKHGWVPACAGMT
jgi:hypothetical protein